MKYTARSGLQITVNVANCFTSLIYSQLVHQSTTGVHFRRTTQPTTTLAPPSMRILPPPPTMPNFKIKCLAILTCSITTTITLYTWARTPAAKQPPMLLWWTPFLADNATQQLNCGHSRVCSLTQNRKYLNESSALLFYGSMFNIYDLPVNRRHILWALLHEESPKNSAALLYPDILGIFNISGTFSRYSDFPLTLQYLPSIDVIIDTTFCLSVEEKNQFRKTLAPILYLQSDCDTPMQRDAFVLELMKYIPVDSYGNCVNNKRLPSALQIDPLNNLYSEELLKFVARYKFVLAMENAACDDYITEKLWRPLIAGSIPIYKGSPTVRDWLPNTQSAILIDEYAGASDVAALVRTLDADARQYNAFLTHKQRGLVANARLLAGIASRARSVAARDAGLAPGRPPLPFPEAFACHVCRAVHAGIATPPVAARTYHCRPPANVGRLLPQNPWLGHWLRGKCEALAVRNLLPAAAASVGNYTRSALRDEMARLQEVHMC